jgi:hypothetical protein
VQCVCQRRRKQLVYIRNLIPIPYCQTVLLPVSTCKPSDQGSSFHGNGVVPRGSRLVGVPAIWPFQCGVVLMGFWALGFYTSSNTCGSLLGFKPSAKLLVFWFSRLYFYGWTRCTILKMAAQMIHMHTRSWIGVQLDRWIEGHANEHEYHLLYVKLSINLQFLIIDIQCFLYHLPPSELTNFLFIFRCRIPGSWMLCFVYPKNTPTTKEAYYCKAKFGNEHDMPLPK